MARIGAKDTAPEMRLRKALHAAGIRYRLHAPDLPGKPDVVLRGWRLAIFVHGCFWHRHAGCKACSMPKSNVEFWKAKFAANVARDERTRCMLRRAGWKVWTIWECETRRSDDVVAMIDAISVLRRLSPWRRPSAQPRDRAMSRPSVGRGR